MNNLLTLAYWFNLRPGALIPAGQRIFIAGLVILIAASIIIAIFKKRGGIYRGFLNRLYVFSVSNAVLGLIFLFFTREEIPFLSARFWLLLWLVAMIVWLILILKKLKAIPAQRQKLEEERERKKYLP
ncbi:MAG: hypothetical protein WC545_01675 [Patescibacteria group bacterium]